MVDKIIGQGEEAKKPSAPAKAAVKPAVVIKEASAADKQAVIDEKSKQDALDRAAVKAGKKKGVKVKAKAKAAATKKEKGGNEPAIIMPTDTILRFTAPVEFGVNGRKWVTKPFTKGKTTIHIVEVPFEIAPAVVQNMKEAHGPQIMFK